jgi:glycosyltransferase involved in cell wall biosynthesis
MHLLAIEGWPTLLAGGQERSLFEVICGLRSQGVDVTLAYEQEGDLVAEYQRRGVHTFQIVTRALILKSWRSPVYIWRFAASLWRILVQNRRARGTWTLIYINQYFDVTLAVLCGAILRIPVVCHLRLGAPPYLSRQFRWGLERCRLLVCNSHFTAKTYVDAGISMERIRVVHNAIDTDAFRPVADDESAMLARRSNRQVLYVGRISPEKGLEILIDAVTIARRVDPRINLLIVGNARGHEATSDYLASLRGRAQQRLGTSVQFREATDDPLQLYRNADLTVLPSVWDEPFGRVVIESLACGVPCLASRAGGVLEILTDELDGLMFEKGNAEDLASHIRTHIDWRIANPGLAVLCREKVLAKFSGATMNMRLLEKLRAAQGAN